MILGGLRKLTYNMDSHDEQFLCHKERTILEFDIFLAVAFYQRAETRLTSGTLSPLVMTLARSKTELKPSVSLIDC